MHPRVTLITLGISDLARSRRFYEALGFTAASASLGDVVFFQMAGGVVLALWPRQELAKDAQIPAADCGGAAAFSGISLAHNVRSAAEVDAVLDEAARAGARILKPGGNVFWGGYTGYFADPDGYLWEVAWNPGFAMTADGGLALSS
jgi:catechol 2,3-dioxygenase-like lactoylglutathione lyase family enzyme